MGISVIRNDFTGMHEAMTVYDSTLLIRNGLGEFQRLSTPTRSLTSKARGATAREQVLDAYIAPRVSGTPEEIAAAADDLRKEKGVNI